MTFSNPFEFLGPLLVVSDLSQFLPFRIHLVFQRVHFLSGPFGLLTIEETLGQLPMSKENLTEGRGNLFDKVEKFVVGEGHLDFLISVIWSP